MSSEKFQEVRQKFAELYPDTNLTLLRNYSEGTLLITFDDLYVVDEEDIVVIAVDFSTRGDVYK